jgi:hypothetical protein
MTLRRWAEITSFLVGVTIAVVLLSGWRVAGGRAELGADVRVSVVQSSTLALSQTGTVLDETHFRPGDHAVAALTVSNRRTREVRVAVRSQPSTDRLLGRLLRVDVRAGSERIFHGRLAALARQDAASLTLPPGASVRVTMKVTLPRNIGKASAARSTQAALLFEERP